MHRERDDDGQEIDDLRRRSLVAPAGEKVKEIGDLARDPAVPDDHLGDVKLRGGCHVTRLEIPNELGGDLVELRHRARR